MKILHAEEERVEECAKGDIFLVNEYSVFKHEKFVTTEQIK